MRRCKSRKETDSIKSQISSKTSRGKKESTKRHHQRHHLLSNTAFSSFANYGKPSVSIKISNHSTGVLVILASYVLKKSLEIPKLPCVRVMIHASCIFVIESYQHFKFHLIPLHSLKTYSKQKKVAQER